MNKQLAIKTGRAIAMLAWVFLKELLHFSWLILLEILAVAAVLFNPLTWLDDEAENDDALAESEWWWYQNHGDPMHIYDKDKD